MPTCTLCHDFYSLDEGCEPTKYCHRCAQERVVELEVHPLWLMYRWLRTRKRTLDGGIYRRVQVVRDLEDFVHYLVPRLHGSYRHTWGWLLNVSWLRWYVQVHPLYEGDETEDEAPYVCPGCYAVGGERCAPGCIDAEIEMQRDEDHRRGAYSSDEEDDEQGLYDPRG